ncbi:MAG: creatininase family protein [Fimbriimonas sp.]|nr:creatininase family protein [Fimbriimonas sp.]
MKLQDATWQDVEGFRRDCVVLIPTGSLEQHGPHLPLFTDSLIVTAVAEAVEARLTESVILIPTLWLGASGHHLRFPGSLSSDFDSYMGEIQSCVESLLPHGFHKFYILNGHGGNREPNGIAARRLKEAHLQATIGQSAYFDFVKTVISDTLEGPLKEMRHACEAETSLMLYLHPDLVRTGKLRDDGLASDPAVAGMVHHFDEITEQGSYGYATLATAEKGERIFDAAVKQVTQEIDRVANGYFLRGL